MAQLAKNLPAMQEIWVWCLDWEDPLEKGKGTHLRRGDKNTQNCTKKDLHDGVITHLEPDILACEVKWALGSLTTNKTSGGDLKQFYLSYLKS